MLHKGFLVREMAHGWRQSLIFILCVALSLATMVALNSFKANVNRTLFRDARNLHGADVILHSHYKFSEKIEQQLEELQKNNDIELTRVHEFYSIVRASRSESTLFAKIKVVDDRFPLYGDIDLQSARKFQSILKTGETIVAENVLKRLNLQLGDILQVGKAQLKIVDVVTHESDSPVNILSFGPRVFVSAYDLEKLDLVKKGSRVEYEILLKAQEGINLEQIASTLKTVATAGQERINTYRDAESGVKRFFDNLLFFLSLISIFTLLLAGLGMQSCLTALIRQKKKTIAITKSIGATNTFLLQHYLIIVLLLGLIGSVLGITSGSFLGLYLPQLFDGLLPAHADMSISYSVVFEGITLGVAVVVLFTVLPLNRLRNIKPIAIFRNDDQIRMKGLFFYGMVVIGIVIMALLTIRQLEDVKIGLSFIAAVIVLIGTISIITHCVFLAAAKFKIKRLALRQASRSLTRDGNGTRSIIITMASALCLLFTIYLVEFNLHRTYIESYPEDAPNLFCLDIQPDQRDEFVRFFDDAPQLFPVIRARILAINNKPVKRKDELKKKRDNFAREFNLTYRDYLLDDEVLDEGKSLFQKNDGGEEFLQVSLLDTVAEMGDIQLHDRLLFNIQGVELEAEVTSIRKRTKSILYPFFYFVFPEQFLKDAPQTFFAAVQIKKSDIAGLENRILDKYPNISFINVSETAEEIGTLMKKLSSIVNFFAAFALLAGGLILVSSILATRMARIRESVYYKILGARTSFVSQVFIFENGLLGFISSLIALIMAHCGSWALCHFLFEIDYNPNLFASVLLVTGTMTFVILLGLMSAYSIVQQKPGNFLREHSNG